jgi:hypothetical protein
LKRAGNLSLWAVGGNSTIDILESELPDEDWEDPTERDFQDVRNRSQMLATGLTHTLRLSERSYLRTSLGFTGTRIDLTLDTLGMDRQPLPRPVLEQEVTNRTLQGHVQYNHKLSNRWSLRTGVHGRLMNINAQDTIGQYVFDTTGNSVALAIPLRNVNASTSLLQGYANLQWRITNTLTANGGVHTHYFELNEDVVIDPRAGIRWQAHPKHALTGGFGIHHQTQPLLLHFTQNFENNTQPNLNMGFFRSQHSIVGYEWTPFLNFRVKTEAYYQALSNLAVSASQPSFSSANFGFGFSNVSGATDLNTDGTGRTYGVELTIEKFFAKHWYLLATGSVFDSRYEGSDGREYNTVYNNGYVLNLLGGVEFPFGPRKNNQVFADLKTTFSGGMRYTPIDRAASIAANRAVEIPTEAFTRQAPDYFRLDLTVGIRQNFKKWSHEIAFQGQNMTNQQNVLLYTWNPRAQDLVPRYQLGLFPIAFYRVTF